MEYTARTFSLPDIPGLSKEQIDVHLGLYQGYVKHVNLLYAELTKLSSYGTEHAYVPTEMRRRLGFEWNGMRLHELYFEQLEGGAQVADADTKFHELLLKEYSSFSNWLEIFKSVPARGPGWALLTFDPLARRFHHVWAADHEVGQLATLPILLAVDHWEHAYMVDYKPADKGKYVEAFFNAVNWDVVAKRFEQATRA